MKLNKGTYRFGDYGCLARELTLHKPICVGPLAVMYIGELLKSEPRQEGAELNRRVSACRVKEGLDD